MKQIITFLNHHKGVDEWRIITTKTTSKEIFFVKNQLQMNRGKQVTKHNITVYKNFKENDKLFKGSSSINFSPVYDQDEIQMKIDQAANAAGFVKNEFYELPKPVKPLETYPQSNFADGQMIEQISHLIKDMYDEDHQFNAFVNSSEFFINVQETRLMNSNGIDVSFKKYAGQIELITEANGDKEAIELFQIINFGDYKPMMIKKEIKEQLYHTSLRAKAIPMPQIDSIPVIIRSNAAQELWGYYIGQVSASTKYDRLHTNKIGDSIQGEDIQGDKLTLSLHPYLENSTRNGEFDADGVYLKPTLLIQDGLMKNFFAGNRHAYYLNVEATGNIGNTIVNPGTYTEKALKKDPYLEIISFSSFQTDMMTGDFGGEFRLGIYFDGEKEIPVTLGTVTGNIKKAQKNMWLSKEIINHNHFSGPKLIKFSQMTIAGN